MCTSGCVTIASTASSVYVRREIHVGRQPADAQVFAAANFLAALAEVAKPRMLEQDRVDFGRIDAGDEQSAVQQRLARAAGRAADLDALIVLRDRQAAPGERFVHLGVRPRHGVLGRPHGDRPAGPALRRRHDAMVADPPLVRFDDDHVEHAGIAGGGPALFAGGSRRLLARRGCGGANRGFDLRGERRDQQRARVIIVRMRVALPNVHVAEWHLPQRAQPCRRAAKLRCASFASSSPVTLPSEMPCVRASTQFRAASCLSSSGSSAARLNVTNPGRENASRHSGSVRATSCLSAASAPGRQVMNTNCGGGVVRHVGEFDIDEATLLP